MCKKKTQFSKEKFLLHGNTDVAAVIVIHLLVMRPIFWHVNFSGHVSFQKTTNIAVGCIVFSI